MFRTNSLSCKKKRLQDFNPGKYRADNPYNAKSDEDSKRISEFLLIRGIFVEKIVLDIDDKDTDCYCEPVYNVAQPKSPDNLKH